jgi:hypothetical protein
MGKNEMGKHKRVAGEVKAATGEYHPPIVTPIAIRIDHYSEHDNRPTSHGSMLTDTTTVEPPSNDTVPGEYDPPRPPPDPPPQTHAK